jgi:hypothetical protein
MKCDESGMGRDESGALGTNRANLGTNQRRRGAREELKRSPDRSGRSQPRRKDTTVELVKFGDARSTGFQPVPPSRVAHVFNLCAFPRSTGCQPVAQHAQVANLSYACTNCSVATYAARALTPSRRVPVKPCAGTRVRTDQERRPPPRAPSVPGRR